MTARKSRRAMFAELLLLANPTHMYLHTDDRALSVHFDSIADMRSWLNLAGLNSPDLLTGEHDGTTDDGRPYRSMTAYPTWHGWEIFAHAQDYADAMPLDTQTAERLAAVAVAG